MYVSYTSPVHQPGKEEGAGLMQGVAPTQGSCEEYPVSCSHVSQVWLVQGLGRKVGGEVAHGGGREAPCAGWPGEGRGAWIWLLGQILTPVYMLVGSNQAAWICASDFIGTDLSSPKGMDDYPRAGGKNPLTMR